ncbi:MAG: formylglycine-generating enzyme family protein [Prevotella sp.]|nr:formylglycine-generating enzyme family protein [Prevotella sp.]
MPPFYIMQTELPISSDITFSNNRLIRSLEAGHGNGDGIIVKSEFGSFLIDLRKQTDIPFRLPTKEEWLYAARGGNKSRGYTYCGGNSIDDVAWYKSNSSSKVHDVALKQPNELGLYDMSGNYAELCSEFDNAPIVINVDGPQYGGSWQDVASDCRVNSWKKGSTTGKISGTGIAEVNAVDGRFVTIRLVYTKM